MSLRGPPGRADLPRAVPVSAAAAILAPGASRARGRIGMTHRPRRRPPTAGAKTFDSIRRQEGVAQRRAFIRIIGRLRGWRAKRVMKCVALGLPCLSRSLSLFLSHSLSLSLTLPLALSFSLFLFLTLSLPLSFSLPPISLSFNGLGHLAVRQKEAGEVRCNVRVTQWTRDAMSSQKAGGLRRLDERGGLGPPERGAAPLMVRRGPISLSLSLSARRPPGPSGRTGPPLPAPRRGDPGGALSFELGERGCRTR